MRVLFVPNVIDRAVFQTINTRSIQTGNSEIFLQLVLCVILFDWSIRRCTYVRTVVIVAYFLKLFVWNLFVLRNTLGKA